MIRHRRKIRSLRIRRKLKDVSKSPRLSVFRSNKFIYAQIIDDIAAKTLLAVSDQGVKEKNRIQRAKEAGLNMAKMASKKNIKKVVFDRGGYKYHGRVKALAEGAKEGGLVF